MAFTPAQDAAIHARNPELLVSAAAGSGKTRVLIERIFDLLVNDQFSVDRLLVVTFTHAAAAEMRERLQTRIAQAALTDRRMRRQAELMESAQISTLHSFCQKLVRQYFQTVEIDPQAMLGETAVCANLLAQAQQEALDWLYEQAAELNPNCMALTAKFEEKQIAGMLEELYPFLMALADPFEWLDACAQKHYTQEDLLHGPMAEAMLADCALLVDGARDASKGCLTLAQDPLCPTAYLPTMKADAQAVEDLAAAQPGGMEALADAASRFALPRLPALRNLEGREAEIRDAYKNVREDIKKAVETLLKTLPAHAEAEIEHLNLMQPALAGLGACTREMDQRYAALKQERNLLDFHDLERMALRILRNPEISAEVAAGFDGVFVDEYQDISGVQEAILNALKPNVSRGTIRPAPLFFYVGDVKQSIYRFRQADPTLFMHKASTFSPLEDAPQRRITLNANFRSRDTVLGTVNRVFAQIMRADVTEIAYDEEARLNAGLPSAGDMPTSLHLFTQKVRTVERVKLQAYAIGREIKRRVGETVMDRDGKPAGTLRYRDIAILGPRMKDVSTVLERTFAEMGIPVYSEENGSGMRSEEITQALQHLRLMDQLADDLALIACLRSPAIGLDERELAAIRLDSMQGSFLEALQKQATQKTPLGARCEAILENLREERFLLAQSPLDEYLWGWLNRSGMYAFYGCQSNGRLRQANLRMLCQKAGEHVQRRGGDLRDFLDSVESQTGVQDSTSPTVLSPWEDVVRVMTIHKSKGLEFPLVFVIGLENAFGSRSRGQLTLHPRLGAALPYVNEKARTTGDTLLQNAIRLRAQAEEKAERARLLYVAMTRARDELILMGCGDQLLPEDAGHGFAGGGTLSAFQVFSAKSMLHWITACVRPGDQAQSCEIHSDREESAWKTEQKDAFSTQSTEFPQKNDVWRIVFHTDEAEVKEALRYARGKKGLSELEQRRAKLEALTESAHRLALRLASDARAEQGAAYSVSESATFGETLEPPVFTKQPLPDVGEDGLGNRSGAADAAAQWIDPIAPALHFAHHPFKVGATALAYAENQAKRAQAPSLELGEGDTGSVESVENKRVPLPLSRPKLMSDLPAMPGFLRPPAAQTGLARGVATHHALAMLQYEPFRAMAEQPERIRAEVVRQMEAWVARRLFTPEERLLVDADTIVRFLQSPVGLQALEAQIVQREWSFNLILPERQGTIVQGVIDLCYVLEGQWSLVDYKTDHVDTPEALWALYGGQVALYRRALSEATRLPVRQATLFSLSLGQGSTR